MRIWIINPFDDVPGEGKAQRFWALANVLAEQKHEVVWWSSDWSHRRKARRVAPKCKSAKVEKCEGECGPPRPLGAPEAGAELGLADDGTGSTQPAIKSQASSICFQLRLVETPPYSRNISFARIWNHRKFGCNLYRDACAAIDSGELSKPDVILASMPPMEGPVASFRLKARYRCRVITDVMDAWPETLLQALPSWASGLGRLCLFPYYKMLRQACLESDAVSAQSQTFADFAKQHGFQGDVHVCYLGADPLMARAQFIFNKRIEGLATRVLRVAYIGAMGCSYDLVTLVTACGNLLNQGMELELHFAGEGEKLHDLQEMTKGWAKGRIHFHGFLQDQELADLLLTCHLGVVPMHPDSGVAVPYKVGDYLSASLAVVNSLPGELETLLKVHECGCFYDAGSVASLESALGFYLDLLPEELAAQKHRASDLFESLFNREKTYPEFAEWVVGDGSLGFKLKRHSGASR